MNSIFIWKEFWMKEYFSLLFLALLLSGAGALNYNITSHEINVDVDKEGFAVVNEKYFMVFQSKEEADEFARIKNNELQFNLDKWQEFDERLKINFGSGSQISELLVDFADEPTGELLYYIELKYSFETPAFNTSRFETGRKALFEINRAFIRSLTHGTDFVIPNGTTITFTLPPQSEPEGELINNPKVRVESDYLSKRKRVIMPGYLSSNEFDFGFSYFKAIAPSFSIAMLVKEFSEKTSRETQLALAFVLGMVLLALYVSRNRIEKRITGFVIKHSGPSEEELEEGKE